MQIIYLSSKTSPFFKAYTTKVIVTFFHIFWWQYSNSSSPSWEIDTVDYKETATVHRAYQCLGYGAE